ncbi:hypothetical protein IQ13_2287 [Lacibacter cauensis]|uniref:Uncharacterized protein n=1 Tax=Lacibacter cauensis TaxID=510947 RepID=A0A562SJ34_9BACT|nr:hypothetical protein [Lacibacter cauensis]TWI81271.1 hypothetical protein IQ13_2287 [Lacibacter cauensis]
MQKLFIPASFLADVFSPKRNLLPCDNGLYLLREEVAANSSRLYQLFFGEQTFNLKKVVTAEEISSEPDYYCNYE